MHSPRKISKTSKYTLLRGNFWKDQAIGINEFLGSWAGWFTQIIKFFGTVDLIIVQTTTSMKTWKKMKNANFCILDKCTDNLFVPNENWTWNCNKWGEGEFHKPENCKTSPWRFSINSEYRSFIPHHPFERKNMQTFVWDKFVFSFLYTLPK